MTPFACVISSFLRSFLLIFALNLLKEVSFLSFMLNFDHNNSLLVAICLSKLVRALLFNQLERQTNVNQENCFFLNLCYFIDKIF